MLTEQILYIISSSAFTFIPTCELLSESAVNGRRAARPEQQGVKCIVQGHLGSGVWGMAGHFLSNSSIYSTLSLFVWEITSEQTTVTPFSIISCLYSLLFCYHWSSAVLLGCSCVGEFIVHLGPFISAPPQNLITTRWTAEFSHVWANFLSAMSVFCYSWAHCLSLHVIFYICFMGLFEGIVLK